MEADFDDTLRLTKRAFKMSGIDVDKTERAVFMKTIFYFNLFWLYCDVLGEFSWLVEGINLGKSFDKLSMVAPCATICLLSTAKIVPFFNNKNTLYAAINKLKNIHSDVENDGGSINYENIVVKESMSSLKSVVFFLYACSAVVVVNFSCLPLFSMVYDYYSTGDTEMKLPFLVKYYFFDAYGSTKVWACVYFHQVWSTIIVCVNIFATETLFYAFCLSLRMHFRILAHRFENIVCSSSEQTNNNLRECVKRHQELIELVNQMQILYSKSTLFNIMTSSLLICLSGFNITVMQGTSTVFAYISFLVMTLMQISLMCFFGDLLMTSSIQVSEGVYKCGWYHADRDIRRSVFIILFRSQKPCKLTAANFADLNLSALTTILSRSWSYFALLRTMYD